MPLADLLEIMGPATAAGLMIALTHAPLGLAVLQRGIIFIDLAIAQIAGLGLLAASLLWHEYPWWAGQLLALAFALVAGIAFGMLERRLPQLMEAIIGSSFVVAASLALLLLADHPHGGEELQHLLSGQILFVTWREAALHAPIYLAILAAWFGAPARMRRGLAFYALFGLAITSSVQLVGVYVVFASLILPALAAAGARHMHGWAWATGIMAMTTGMLGAVIMDLPAGPVIVVSYAGWCILMRMLQKAVRAG